MMPEVKREGEQEEKEAVLSKGPTSFPVPHRENRASSEQIPLMIPTTTKNQSIKHEQIFNVI